MTKWVLEVWSVRRFRAWRRGLMQPIWQVVSSIRPLQFAQGLGDKIVRTWCCRGWPWSPGFHEAPRRRNPPELHQA